MSDSDRPIPQAVLRPQRRVSLAWLLPLAAIVFAAWLGWRAWQARGLTVLVQLEEGHGLKKGDDVRYRGMLVGMIDDVTLADDLKSVMVTARLTAQADRLARGGSRFWVVRPQLALTRIEGLDTIIGPRFLAVLPANESTARPQRQFVGLIAPPAVEHTLPGDLEIVLETPQRGSLVAGAPVYYRQTRVGTILSVGLAGDGGSVEARVHIQQPFVPLIRQRTRFWDAGGLKAEVGLTGFSVDIESAEALLAGGVALATPPPVEAGDMVHTGHRFRLEAEPAESWQQWRPLVAIGHSLLPPGESPPSPLRASMGWKQGGLFSREKSRHGWVLQTDQGVLGPDDLLRVGDNAERESVVLEVSGQVVPLRDAPTWQRNGLAMLRATVLGAVAWPSDRMRQPADPEECVAIADSISNPLPIAAARLSVITGEGGAMVGWNIDSAITVDPTWHGACVVARSDGKLLGMLLVTDDGARVAAISQ